MSMTWKEATDLLAPKKKPKIPTGERGLIGSEDVELSTGITLYGFPKGVFDVVYLDPPWQYGDTLNCGDRGADHKYDTMSMQELLEIPVPNLLHQDSIVAMWITTPFMSDAMLLARLWGLELITRGFLWTKINKNNNRPFKGLGHWTRGNPEDVYFFRPKGGKFKPQFVPDELVRDRIREHSRKPDMVRHRLDQIAGDHYPAKIELFAREASKGWVAWGNEVDKFSEQ